MVIFIDQIQSLISEFRSRYGNNFNKDYFSRIDSSSSDEERKLKSARDAIQRVSIRIGNVI